MEPSIDLGPTRRLRPPGATDRGVRAAGKVCEALDADFLLDDAVTLLDESGQEQRRSHGRVGHESAPESRA